MKKKLISFVYTMVMSVLFLSFSGITSLADAAATCNKEAFRGFYQSGTKTIAITQNPLTWEQALQLAEANGGTLVSVLNSQENDRIINELAEYFSGSGGEVSGGTKRAWIGLYDPNKIPNYCQGGVNCQPNDSRFEWVKNFTSYTNWADGQPENLCTNEEREVPPFKCYGENWVAMDATGKWSDVGDHGPDSLQLPGIVEFPTVLDCASNKVPPKSLEDFDLYVGGDVCTNQAKTRFNVCDATVETTEGIKKNDDGTTESIMKSIGLCPEEMVACNDTSDPVCTGDGTLDQTRSMCQKDAMISCPDNGIYESTIDKCHKSVVCSEGGSLNGSTDKCEKIPTDTCPEGYVEDGIGYCAKATEDCSNIGGVYNPAQNRCEKSVVTQCPDGFIATPIEGSSDFNCSREPLCESGNYSTTFDKCLKPYIQECPTGYSYVSERNRCEVIPYCSVGTWNPTTGKCEETVVNQTCPTGTLVGSVCETTETAAPGNGYLSSECRGAIMWCNAAYMDIYGGWNTCNTYYLAQGGIFYCISQCNVSCSSDQRCQVGWDFDTTNNLCTRTTTTEPNTSTTIVQHNPSCPTAAPASATMDYTNKVCYSNTTPACDAGWAVDIPAGACAKVPDCEGTLEGVPYSGIINGSTDKCELSLQASCAPLNIDPESFVCYSDPYCSQGSFDRSRNQCVVSIAKDCGTYALEGEVCQTAPQCEQGTYSAELDSCVFEAIHDCGTASDYTWQGNPVNKCEAIPTCPGGVYNSETHKCKNSEGTCPIGDFQCLHKTDDPFGNSYCSPNKCTDDIGNLIEIDDTEQGADDIKPDGTIDENGNCSGSYYIFNGFDMRCTKYDKTGQVVGIAKLIIQVILSVVSFGAAAAVIMACSAINAAVTIAADAAMGTLGLGTAIGVVTSLAGGYVNAYGGGWLNALGMGDGLEQLGNGVTGTITSQGVASLEVVNTMGMQSIEQGVLKGVAEIVTTETGIKATFQMATDLGGGLFQIDQVVVNMVTDPSIMDQVVEGVKAVQPVIQEAAGGKFSVKKCCYPDKVDPTCTKLERQEWEMQAAGKCVVVGTYCDSEFIGCLEEKETSCCFNSMLARIIHEQGRKQLTSFKGPYGMVDWGEAKHPTCRGFKPEEFQFLDFSQIDLQEYIDTIITHHPDSVTNLIKFSAEKYMHNMTTTQHPEGQ